MKEKHAAQKPLGERRWHIPGDTSSSPIWVGPFAITLCTLIPYLYYVFFIDSFATVHYTVVVITINILFVIPLLWMSLKKEIQRKARMFYILCTVFYYPFAFIAILTTFLLF